MAQNNATNDRIFVNPVARLYASGQKLYTYDNRIIYILVRAEDWCLWAGFFRLVHAIATYFNTVLPTSRLTFLFQNVTFCGKHSSVSSQNSSCFTIVICYL